MITLTEKAAEKVSSYLTKRGGCGIRIGVKTTGCSGLAYVLEYVDVVNPEDHVVDCGLCTVYIDGKSMPYLTGLTVDWVKEGLNQGFKFNNPNERNRCGCGESFNV